MGYRVFDSRLRVRDLEALKRLRPSKAPAGPHPDSAMDQNQWVPATTPPSLARKASKFLRRAIVRMIQLFAAAAFLFPVVMILLYWKSPSSRPFMSALFVALWPTPLLPMMIGLLLSSLLLGLVANVLSSEGEV